MNMSKQSGGKETMDIVINTRSDHLVSQATRVSISCLVAQGKISSTCLWNIYSASMQFVW